MTETNNKYIIDKLNDMSGKLDSIEKKVFKESTFWYFIFCFIIGVFWHEIINFIISIPALISIPFSISFNYLKSNPQYMNSLYIFLIYNPNISSANYNAYVFNGAAQQIRDNARNSADIEYQRVQNELAKQRLKELQEQDDQEKIVAIHNWVGDDEYKRKKCYELCPQYNIRYDQCKQACG